MAPDSPVAMVEMPKYESHKKVHALKIAEIDATEGGAFITPEEEGYAQFRVSDEYLLKHKPKVGGYYVVYADGYKSWSPAEAFEEGYTLIP